MVDEMREAAGLSYARKEMIRCGLSLDVSGRWHKNQLSPELQQIISKYRRHFEGVPVPIPGADIMPQ
uniref:Uncharacterized protein n=1 Tax=Hyaloperonospora arabidopsidis (strain Emoy2) TaxID=559515 RepID=M4B587_HYAAE